MKIRQECQARREGDHARDEPFFYTFLIDLKEIIDRQWRAFEPLAKSLIDAKDGQLSKKELMDILQETNDVRNRYAHPVRAPKSESSEYDAHLQSAKEALDIVNGLYERVDSILD